MSRRSVLPPEGRTRMLVRRRSEGLTHPELSAQSGWTPPAKHGLTGATEPSFRPGG